MGYCPCFGWRKGKKLNSNVYTDINRQGKPPEDVPESTSGQSPIPKADSGGSNKAQTFTYRELAAATKNFRVESFIGQGGFGAVYKGQLESTGQVVAVKKLDTAGLQGEKEFLVEVLMLSLLRHPNLVNLIGYCAEGDQRLLVYEYMNLGSLEDHLHAKEPLDWNTRMMIAAGAAKGLDYLHNQADPPVIYRDLKTSNILLDEGFHPKLSDFGLAKFAPSGDRTHVSTRVMGTHGYCAPEYAITGKLTAKSDVYCFGVVLLELITGLRALDDSRGHEKEVLVNWARPLLKDPMTCVQLADPRLKGQFKESTLKKALELASMCIREESSARPPISDILPAMNYFTSHLYNLNEAPRSHSGSRSHRDAIAKSGGMILEKEGQIREFKVDIKGGSESENSPRETTRMLNKDLDRERAVAEAKMWGETWREKRLQSAQTSPDGLII